MSRHPCALRFPFVKLSFFFLSEIFASRQQVGELAVQQVRASNQQVQLMQQLTQLVDTQSAHIGRLTEVIEGMQVADKERGEELRQLRASVAAQQQQPDAGAAGCMCDGKIPFWGGQGPDAAATDAGCLQLTATPIAQAGAAGNTVRQDR